MDNSELNKFYTELIGQLWSNIIFYVPKKIIPQDIISQFTDIKEAYVFDKHFIIDYYIGPINYNVGIDNNGIIYKSVALEKITFLLLDKKSTLSNIEFTYIFDKYFEQLDCILFITNWLNSNLHYMDEKDNKIISNYKIQFTSYKNHFKTIVKYFFTSTYQLPKSSFNALELIEENFKHKTTKEDDNNKRNNNSVFSVFPKQNEIIKTGLKKTNHKKPLITALKAEEDILKRIFKIG